jgi:hypothetical protein
VIEPELRAVSGCVTLAKQALAPDRPLRILVLGDPDARICRLLADEGHDVACCPDLQRPRSGEADHVDVVAPEASALTESGDQFDLAVAVDGWTRMLATHSPTQRGHLLDWLRSHARVTLVTAPRQPMAPDLNHLGPYRVQEILGAFRYLSEAVDVDGDESLVAPLVLASDQYLVAGNEWIADSDVGWLGEADPLDADKTVRTLRIPGARIAKVEFASEEYFDRTQVLAEWDFLSGVDPRVRDLLGLPRVHLLNRGRSVITLVRDAVVGGAAGGLPVAAQLEGALAVGARYAEAGLFHNDFRPWNLLWHEGEARLIDFEWTSSIDDDAQGLPQVLALAGTLAGIATDEVRMGDRFHEDVLHLTAEAGLLERWPLAEQVDGPWGRVPALRAGVHVAEGMTATEIIHNVLEVTVG